VPTLRRIVADLKRRFPAGSIRVDGHSDGKGTDAYNADLSTRRADAVKRWLGTEGGIAAARITTRGYGEKAPIARETTSTGADDPAGRAKNRRVVISAST
jgi:outer membrane protein OmpA-like peptidoglycan-associated protein